MNAKESLQTRWETTEGKAIRDRLMVLLATEDARLDRSFQSFGSVDGRLDLRGITIESTTVPKRYGKEVIQAYQGFSFHQHQWTDLDFSDARIIGPFRFHGCRLNNVRFSRIDGGPLEGFDLEFRRSSVREVMFQDFRMIWRDLESRFEQSRWKACAYDGGVVGLLPSQYKACVFDDLQIERNLGFVYGEFTDCVFKGIRAQWLDFRMCSFDRCAFIGTVPEVFFRGPYARWSGDAWWRHVPGYWRFVRKTPAPRPNRMTDVDFSHAELSSWVRFIDGCDLSTVILPADQLVERIDNWPQVYNKLCQDGSSLFSETEWKVVQPIIARLTPRRPFVKGPQRYMIIDFRSWSTEQTLVRRAHDVVVGIARSLSVLGQPTRR